MSTMDITRAQADHASKSNSTHLSQAGTYHIETTTSDTSTGSRKVSIVKRQKTKTGRHGGHPAQKRHTAAAISLAAHPRLRPSGLLLLLGQKFGLLGLLGLLLLLLLLLLLRQHGGGGGGGAGGTSSNGALLGALDGGDREQREHVVVVAAAVAVVVVAVVAAENALVLL
jgi:hypothetical protein